MKKIRRYKIWDKKEDIVLLGPDSRFGKSRWSAEEYMEVKAQWAKEPNAKVVVAAGSINGLIFRPFDDLIYSVQRRGFEIPDGLSDDEILMLIEEFQDQKNDEPSPPSAEERIASALEFQNLLAM